MLLQEQAPVFGRLTNILQILALLRDLDLKQILDLLRVVTDNSQQVKVRVVAALDLARIICEATPNEVDDRVVEYIDRILIDAELLDLVVDLVEKYLRGEEIRFGTVEKAQGIPIVLIIQIVMAILTFIKK